MHHTLAPVTRLCTPESCNGPDDDDDDDLCIQNLLVPAFYTRLYSTANQHDKTFLSAHRNVTHVLQ
jgi:hypothetical protein